MSTRADKMRGKLGAAKAPTAPPGTRAPDPLAPNKALTWEERHKRATFHLDRELVAEVKAAAKADDSTISSWVGRALRTALDAR